MNKHLYTLTMLLLIVVASYGFYTLWHSDVITHEDITVAKKSEATQDLSQKKHITRSREPLMVPAEKSTITPLASQSETEKAVYDKKYFSQLREETAEKNREVYDELKPDDYEEVMEEAKENFAILDIKLEALKAEIEEQMDTRISFAEDIEYE